MFQKTDTLSSRNKQNPDDISLTRLRNMSGELFSCLAQNMRHINIEIDIVNLDSQSKSL